MIHIPKTPHSTTLRWDDPKEPCTMDCGEMGTVKFILLKYQNGANRYEVEFVDLAPELKGQSELLRSIIIKHASTHGYGVAAPNTEQR
jgi:hypothetical protein